jgi:hypothetical protein
MQKEQNQCQKENARIKYLRTPENSIIDHLLGKNIKTIDRGKR